MSNSDMLTVGTVFSGIGSVEHAIKKMKLRHKIAFACDNNKWVKESYFANYDIDDKRWYDDIVDIDGKKYENKLDLLVGGSPCQSFSMIGNRLGTDDERGMLIYEFIKLIKKSQPKMFIFENVKGLLTHNSGETWQMIYKKFTSMHYFVSWKVMNSKHYGVPQHRDRLFVVGFRNVHDKELPEFEFPEKIPLSVTMQDLLEDTPNPKYFLPEKGIKFVTKQKNLDKKYTKIDGDIQLCQKANQQFNWHGHFIMDKCKPVDNKYILSNNVRKYVMSTGTKNYHTKIKTDLEIARPLLQSMHKCHRAGVDNYVTDNRGLRKLTPRECMRLMGFDDTYKIVVSDLQAYRQSGNSIVVNVLVELISKMIKYDKKNKNR